jgi:hypothetical protein
MLSLEPLRTYACLAKAGMKVASPSSGHQLGKLRLAGFITKDLDNSCPILVTLPPYAPGSRMKIFRNHPSRIIT